MRYVSTIGEFTVSRVAEIMLDFRQSIYTYI